MYIHMYNLEPRMGPEQGLSCSDLFGIREGHMYMHVCLMRTEDKLTHIGLILFKNKTL